MQEATIWKKHTPVWSHDSLIGSNECLLLFTPSCCGECFLILVVCACTGMLCMYVLYVSFGSMVRLRTFVCVVIVGKCCLF